MNKTIVFSCDTPNKKLTRTELDKIFGILFGAGIKVAPAIGVYNGHMENSFICPVTTDNHEKMILAFVKSYKQEAILEISEEGFSFLRFFDDKPLQYVGVWQPIKTLPKDNYTMNLLNGLIYKCS